MAIESGPTKPSSKLEKQATPEMQKKRKMAIPGTCCGHPMLLSRTRHLLRPGDLLAHGVLGDAASRLRGQARTAEGSQPSLPIVMDVPPQFLGAHLDIACVLQEPPEVPTHTRPDLVGFVGLPLDHHRLALVVASAHVEQNPGLGGPNRGDRGIEIASRHSDADGKLAHRWLRTSDAPCGVSRPDGHGFIGDSAQTAKRPHLEPLWDQLKTQTAPQGPPSPPSVDQP